MKITVNCIDNLNPEIRCMLQAFYSRSQMPIEERLNDLGNNEDKIKENLKKYYVGYGHASIGDCSNTTIFLEGVSMLAAKAIQDHPLYNGQEGSTRYIDYSSQQFIIPSDTKCPEFYIKWSEKFRVFYAKNLPILIDYIKELNPGDGSSVYNKTVTAKAFDILRGFLPAGFSTNVAWTGTLRSVGEHLRKLWNHPLKEIRDIAIETYSKLSTTYPNSFRQPRESDFFENKYFYGTNDVKATKFSSAYFENGFVYDKLDPFYKFVNIQCEIKMDFASWRDLQRHRNMVYLMPLLTTNLGFEPFYIQSLPAPMQDEANTLLTEFSFELDKLEDSKYNKQYIIPMAYLCSILMQCHVNQAVYLAELRSSKTVHPTLRTFAQELGRFLKYQFDISCNIDYSEDNWTLKRGTQDITKT